MSDSLERVFDAKRKNAPIALMWMQFCDLTLYRDYLVLFAFRINC